MKVSWRAFLRLKIIAFVSVFCVLWTAIVIWQHQLENRRAANLIEEMRAVAKAHLSYLEKYKYPAGYDPSNANTIDKVNRPPYRITGNTAFNLSPLLCGTDLSEQIRFWGKLRQANLYPGEANDCANPRHSDGGLIGVQTGDGKGGQILTSSKEGLSGFLVCANSVLSLHAQKIDEILDDGMGSAGLVRAGGNGASIPSISREYDERHPANALILCMPIELLAEYRHQ